MSTPAKKSAKKSDENTKYFGDINRDLRTPLTDVLGMAHLLNETTLSDDQKKYVQAIMRASHEVLVRIDNTLDLAQFGDDALAVKEEYFGVTEALLAMVERMRPSAVARELDISLDMAPDVNVKINCDRARLSQAIYNLAAHIIAYHKDGRIRMAARIEGDQWGHHLILTVSTRAQLDIDEGASTVDSQTLETTCRLARLMGGEVTIEKEDGQPNQMCLKIRVEMQDLEEEEATRPGFILVAEDSRANQRLIGLILNKLGHEFEVVCDGSAAVEAAKRTHYDMILMDLHMPKMDGMEACRTIRAFEDEAVAMIPIIALTADVRPQLPVMVLEAGMDALLTKPLDVAKLADTITTYLQNPRKPSEAKVEKLAKSA